MPPTVEAFYQACDKNVAWCLPNKLPPFRLAAGQLPPRVRKPMHLINDRLNHLDQQVRKLGEENQWLLAENRTLREQAENHDADVQALLHREVSRVKDIHALEDKMCGMRLKAIEQEEYLGIMSLQLEAKERESTGGIKDTKAKSAKRQMKEEGELKKEDYETYKKLKTKAENEVLNVAEVVVTTCIASFDKRLNNYRFPIVLVDEATQSCEGECLLPLLRGAKHAILVGDHCQLGPVVLCKNAAKAGLKMSLFERLIKLKIKPHMLQVQYRMHPMLSEFPSNTFYNGNLQNGVSADERIHYSVNFNWPNPNKPMFFYHIAGQEEFSASGTSYLNRKEAEFIEKSVTALLKSCNLFILIF